MRTRLCALLVVGLLLAPLPALAAPDRASDPARGWSLDALYLRLADAILKVFGASGVSGEEDLGPQVDPDGLAAPRPGSPPEGNLGPGVDPDGFTAPPKEDLGPVVDPNG